MLRVGDAPRGAGPERLDLPLAAVEHELDRRAPCRGSRVSCVVAGDALRYAVVPWSDELTSAAQRQVLAEHCFIETYGDAARHWTVRQHTARHGAAALACALDTALLERLAAALQARGLKLASVQPALMHAFNQVRVEATTEPGWFVCIESVWTTALLNSAAGPLLVKQRPTAGLDLPRWLGREAFAFGLDAPPAPVHAVRAAGVEWHAVDPASLTAAPAAWLQVA